MGNVCCSENNNLANADNANTAPMLPFNANFRTGSAKDRAYGAIMGALVANACGSFTDKSKRQLQAPQVFHVMSMPGGGYHGTAPGQITDDGELTMCLLRAIVEGN